jgi:sugar-specific transcriptional regulator TrmB
MAYRNKTYVAFDADNDMRYYNTMKMWKQNDNIDFNFYNAHDIKSNPNKEGEDAIKRDLMERFRNSKMFVLLVGENTKYLYKYVRWEIEQAIARDLPIIIVNINNKRQIDEDLCPKIAKDTLAIHISFQAKILQYALENWESACIQCKNKEGNKSYFYKDSVYKELGL